MIGQTNLKAIRSRGAGIGDQIVRVGEEMEFIVIFLPHRSSFNENYEGGRVLNIYGLWNCQ
jgi:hypothetical protein